jgi:hypothetical protein
MENLKRNLILSQKYFATYLLIKKNPTTLHKLIFLNLRLLLLVRKILQLPKFIFNL